MASYTASVAKHATLVSNTVDTITFTKDVGHVEVLNRSSVDMYFSVDGTNPTVAGDCYVVTGGGSLVVDVQDNAAAGGTVVKIVASTAAPYSVLKAV